MAKRRRARRVTAERRANPQSDLGTPQLKRHHLVVIEGSGRPHGRVVDQRPLDRYLVRGQLSENGEIARALHEAGHRLRTDWTIAGLEPRLIAHMGPRGHGPENFTDRQLAARRRKDQALAAVGPAFVPVLIHVACCDGTAGEWARGQGKREREPRGLGNGGPQAGAGEALPDRGQGLGPPSAASQQATSLAHSGILGALQRARWRVFGLGKLRVRCPAVSLRFGRESSDRGRHSLARFRDFHGVAAILLADGAVMGERQPRRLRHGPTIARAAEVTSRRAEGAGKALPDWGTRASPSGGAPSAPIESDTGQGTVRKGA